MEREVSLTVEISVALVAICAVISIIWFTVYLGNDVANQSSETASEIIATMESTVLEELSGEGEIIMPSASIYNVLRTYSNAIPEFECEICKKNPKKHTCVKNSVLHERKEDYPLNLVESNYNCVITHLEGKVHVLVKDRPYGGYKVIISDKKIN